MARNQTRPTRRWSFAVSNVIAWRRAHIPVTRWAYAAIHRHAAARHYIGGQALHYRRTEDGKFLFYSIGWNGKDDGGQLVLNDGRPSLDQGDWVRP